MTLHDENWPIGAWMVLASNLGFVEAPTWDPALGLFVADQTRGGIWSVEPGALRQVVPHRRGISGLAVHESGGFVVSGRNVALKGERTSVVLVEQDATCPAFGDLTVDLTGRVLVGAFGSVPVSLDTDPTRPAGRLLCLGLDGTVTVVDPDVLLPNGLATTPDGTTLYLVDTLRRHVTARDVRTDGSFGPPRVLVRLCSGMPDGLALDVEGRLWVAALEGGLQVYSADGALLERYALDGIVTSVYFAGDALTTLVVTVVDPKSGQGSVLARAGLGPGVAVGRAGVAFA